MVCKSSQPILKKKGVIIPSDLVGFILRGNYPPYLLDAIELLYEELPEAQTMQLAK